MSLSSAVESDPYTLPAPTPDSPVVLPRWIRPSNTLPNSRYGDLIWSLGPLIDNPGTGHRSIHWRKCPAVLRDELMLTAWTMINGELRPTYLETRGTSARSRSGPIDLQTNCQVWMRLARWLSKRGITNLADCTEAEWRAYASHRIGSGMSRSTAETLLGRWSDLWAFDQLRARPTGIARPPWDIEGIDDYLPQAGEGTGGENSKEPLDPKVLGPLLVWAIRVVDDFADDILAAWAERCRLVEVADTNVSSPETRASLENFLLPMIRAGAPLPAVPNAGGMRLCLDYVAAVTGATPGQTYWFSKKHSLGVLVTQSPGPCPLEIPVTGKVNGKPWRENMDFGEAAELMRTLGTAAMIIVLYLTGMRPQEVRTLRSGCCPDPAPEADVTSGRHLIHGRHYKNVTDEDGNHVSAGEEREVPWVAISPVVHAIRVLERIVPEGEFLFSSAHHDFIFERGYPGVLKPTALNKRVEDFVTWVNREAGDQGLLEQTIPKDPFGSIGLARFRRTLAWHIARRPGGLIALAIQYGHMRTVLDARTSSGCGSRTRRGVHGVLDVETALAAADTAARLRDRLAAGEKVSGPAARRAVTAASQAPRFEGRIVTSKFAQKAAAFLARDGAVLFDNPDSFLICVFKRDNALCKPDPDATAPRQYDCQPGCGNAVRTDSHARMLQKRADEIDELAAYAPDPVGNRLRVNAERLRTIAATHDATAEALT
ncbi:integrase [Streptomyces sp. NPDC002690]